MTTLYEYLAFVVSAAAAMWLFKWLGIEHAPEPKRCNGKAFDELWEHQQRKAVGE